MNWSRRTWIFIKVLLRLKNKIGFSRVAILMALGFWLVAPGCNKPTDIGSDIFEGDNINLFYADSFPIDVKTVRRDPALIYFSPEVVPNTQLIGSMNDAVAGRTEAEVFASVDFVRRVDGNPFQGFEIDSILLTLRYDTFGIYGNLDQPVTFHVYEVEEFMDDTENYDSDRQWATSSVPLVSHEFTPRPRDSINIEAEDTTVKVSARLIVPIENNDFKQRLMESDSAIWAEPDSFRYIFPGFNFELEAENTMLGFNFESNVSQIRIEYFDPDSIEDRRSVVLLFTGGAMVSSYYFHDHSQGMVGRILADSNATVSDTLAIIQEMQGLSPKLTIRNLSQLHGTLINSAELTMTIKDTDDPMGEEYPQISLIGIQKRDSIFRDVVDTWSARRDAQRDGIIAYLSTFGGQRQMCKDTAQNKYIYTAAITSHIQDVVNKGLDSTSIYVNSYYQAESPRRTVLYGSESPHPVKMIVRYTKVD